MSHDCGPFCPEHEQVQDATDFERCQSVLVLGPDLKVRCENIGGHDQLGEHVKHGAASMRFVEFDSGSFVPTTLIWFT